MKTISFLLRRYWLPSGGNLLGLALWVSVAGVALGVAQLMLVLSVMSGFLQFLEDKYTNITSQVVVIPRGERVQASSFRKGIESVPGITATTPFFLGQAMVIHQGVGGVTLEGIERKDSGDVTPWEEVWVDPPETKEPKVANWIWLGKGLADKIKVKKGETVRVLFPDKNKPDEEFVVEAITKFGIYDHDLRYAYLDRTLLQEKMDRVGTEPLYKLKLDRSQTEPVVAGLRKEMGSSATIKRWIDINQNIFLAVRHQKKLLFLVLDIIVALAGLNVVNLLMMSSQQRKKDIAILRAMGMRFRSVVLFFVVQGAMVGVVGVVAGIGLGFLLIRICDWLQPAILSESVYNVSRLPFQTEAMDVTIIGVVTLVLCVLFSVIPALKAAAARPVQALRYE